VESEIKYEGYIMRANAEIEAMGEGEKIKLSKETDYDSIPGLSNEAKEKLSFVRPENLGQASRVSGITPSDASVLAIHARKNQSFT
jgi:tRNA uridine 5-carboxymethylaminomethyl modification enzyme